MCATSDQAALLVDGAFDALGLVPDLRPDRADVFGSIGLDYKLALNLVGAVVFVALFALTVRRGATDPVCGMTVDRGRALHSEHAGVTYYFCCAHCRERFESDPARHVASVEGRRRAAHAH